MAIGACSAVAVAGLGAAAEADAYRLGGRTWAKRTVTYRVDVVRYRAPVNEAARQWNTSGVNFRFREIRSGRPDIVVRRLPVGPGARCFGVLGRATLGAVPRGVGFLQLNAACDNTFLIAVAVHELGHVLGLSHSNRSCAVMWASAINSCTDTRSNLPWETVCKPLRSDDVAGAIRRYGGKARPLPTNRVCVTKPTPPPVTGLAIAVNPAGSVAAARLTWTNPVSPALNRVVVNRNPTRCATLPGTPGISWAIRPGIAPVFGDEVVVRPAAAGAQAVADIANLPAGRTCWAVWTVGPQNRYLRAATVVVDYPGPATGASRIALTAAPAAGVDARLTWTNPDEPVTAVTVLASSGPCPADPSGFSGGSVAELGFVPGPAAFDIPPGTLAGTSCLALSFRGPGSATAGPFMVQVG